MKTNRRDFLGKAAILTAGSLAIPYLSQAARMFDISLAARPIGIQLFTVFKPMNEDPAGTLKKIAAIGYK